MSHITEIQPVFHAAMLGLLLVAACTPSDPYAHLASPTMETLPGGMRVVKNLGPTAWTDTSGWKLVLERTIHPAEGSPGALSGPRAIVADDSGRVFVLDRKPGQIKWFNADGSFGGLIGRAGGGPGEYQDYGWLYIVNDTLVHLDPSQGRMSAFTAAGAFIRSWPGLSRYANDQVADDSGRVPTGVRLGEGGINSGQGLIRFHADGTVADSLWYPSAPEPKTWSLKTKTQDLGMLVPFVPDQVAITDRAGRMVSGNQGRYRLIFSRNGKDTSLIVEGIAQALPISDSLRRATLAESVKDAKWLLSIAKLEDIPTTFPVWTNLIADGENNLWVLRAGPSGDGEFFDVFAASGALLGKVPAPFREVESTYWARDRVYVVAEADDVPVIRVYRIRK
ncbi:MAG: hypothetical protein V4558_06730 [Gemmatimonadota bacterium]